MFKRRIPNRTDLGNAAFFAALFREKVCFDHARKRWLFFEKHWWTTDGDGKLIRMAKQVPRLRLENSAKIADKERRESEARWAMQSESLARIKAILALAESEKHLAIEGTNWDHDPWLLGVANGVVDLRTGKLRPGSPGDRITLHTEIEFTPSTQSPRWDRFLMEIFDGDSELVSFVHRATGYTLTGDTSEQCFFCCYGLGGNGKGKFLEALRYVLGGYACNLPFSAFELQARSSIPNDLATLPGRRFVTAIESDETARLNEARIKALTGCDPITARLLYREYFTFTPQAKFWLAFNHRPPVLDDSHGFWRRVRLIPFVRQFKTKAEPELEKTLRAEAPGILAWAVRGCLEWQVKGLGLPIAVKTATDVYREESNPLSDFMADRTISDPDAKVGVGCLWSEYNDWAKENAERNPLNRSQFTSRLEGMGYRKDRCGHRRDRMWIGICRKQDSQAQGLRPGADARTCADAKFN